MTNADKIRSMSNDELAKFITDISHCEDRDDCHGCSLELENLVSPEDVCVTMFENGRTVNWWLGMEVKENNEHN